MKGQLRTLQTKAPKPLAGNRAHRLERHLSEYVELNGRRRFVNGCWQCEWLKEEYPPHCVMPAHDPAYRCLEGHHQHCVCKECF